MSPAAEDTPAAYEAAKQFVDREGEHGATALIGEQFINLTRARILAEEEATPEELQTWDEMDPEDQRYIREIFAQMIQDGHLHVGRNTDLPDSQERLDEAEGLITGLLALIDTPKSAHMIRLANAWKRRYLDDMVRANGRCPNCLELTGQCRCESLATDGDRVEIEVSEDSDRRP
jgi:hypothetical protein